MLQARRRPRGEAAAGRAARAPLRALGGAELLVHAEREARVAGLQAALQQQLCVARAHSMRRLLPVKLLDDQIQCLSSAAGAQHAPQQARVGRQHPAGAIGGAAAAGARGAAARLPRVSRCRLLLAGGRGVQRRRRLRGGQVHECRSAAAALLRA